MSVEGKSVWNRPVASTGRRCLLAMALAIALANGAQAQSITGGLYGREAGGVTVQVSNASTGFRRDLVADKDGKYAMSGLNPGTYEVTIVHGGQAVGSRTINVVANSLTAVSAVEITAGAPPGAVDARTLDAVNVSSMVTTTVNPIDVSTPELATNYSMKLVNQLPTGRSMESIALLKSSVRYDDQTTNLVQMGGASPGENRYYYNEFDTTYDFSGLGASRLPPEAISSTQVITGNFGTSWTSTTGGITAATVRQGTNDFKAGYSLYFEPPTSRLLNPRDHDSLTRDGDYYKFNRANHHGGQVTDQYLWASGAAVRDKVFYFVMLGNSPASTATSYKQNLETDRSTRDKNALVNLTWNITSNQSVNVVGYRDWTNQFDNQYTLDSDYEPASRGSYYGWAAVQTKNQFLIGNYHAQLTDDLSFRLMGGYLSQSQLQPTSSSGSGLPYVQEQDPVTKINRNIGAGNATGQLLPFEYWRRGFKGDFTWQLGDHRITAGAEHYKHFINQRMETTEGGYYTYYNQPGVILDNGSPSPADGRYVSQYYNSNGGSFYTVNKAAYIDDNWQVSDNVVLYGGARFDVFINKDVNGNNFLRLPLTSPRLGIAWDVEGDSSLKVGANAGKYTIPIPSTVNNGAATAVTRYTKYYTYTGMDPVTKAPTGLTQIGDTNYLFNGLAPTPEQISTSNITAPYQYEFQIYVQKQLGSAWAAQAEIGYTNLKKTIDDTCYLDSINAYARSHGYPDYTEKNACFLLNPGSDVQLKRDFRGDGNTESLTIPGSEFGMPAAKRRYYHMTLELTHASTPDAPYFLDLSYTWAHLYGNTDGYIDLGHRVNGAAGEQVLFDYPGLMVGGTGNLTGDIRNAVTASGIYYFPGGVRVGGILNMHTGSPLNCFGTYPDQSDPAYQYGPSSHFCDSKLSPLGHAKRLPFFWALNLSVGYDWQIDKENALSVDVQMQNVTNRQGIVNREQTYDEGVFTAQGDSVHNPAYGSPSWQTPRTTSLILRYTFR
ncbi:carboxypeptidase family protein [Luteibacter rhizovicinus]|uniref:Carboxypeptidase family protein n=1 Tax=Luteibacter rhizovicinus TaxID=242606 RepID=A0A4R3YZW1_9GAMM|nr:carboxypeptidase regulatory-like domain-containing protein [Luteibacter rhizovicinus]TCV97468.1 carboxypeptidase family protein [Luteibacter rhizovicinus]